MFRIAWNLKTGEVFHSSGYKTKEEAAEIFRLALEKLGSGQVTKIQNTTDLWLFSVDQLKFACVEEY